METFHELVQVFFTIVVLTPLIMIVLAFVLKWIKRLAGEKRVIKINAGQKRQVPADAKLVYNDGDDFYYEVYRFSWTTADEDQQ